ncbi:Lipoprotein signal peptidase [Actinomyces bovis]|uniref:Lipoprotein signal peptidase n=1 Tax=Actinomyces bovis TaxID=1658 RepID=A0ABY1VP90_9ACTO|nr:signal peptidase II [Actinomyces bovis]SPT53940.1 Lipoprotein signal peptidase [Actinomyces bovis]VEG53446.1 Lipoprotein signal peptidase [Actinomyces israelii]
MESQDSTSVSPDHQTTGNRRLVILLWLLAGLVVAADQATKLWALHELADEGRRPLLGSLLGLRLVFNPGAAFSFASGQTWIFTIVAVVVVVVIARVARRLAATAWAVALALVLGGAIGNLIDRLFRAPGVGRGYVVDFIDYGVFVGNVADIAIVAAAGMIMWLTATGRELDGKLLGQDPEAAQEGPVA